MLRASFAVSLVITSLSPKLIYDQDVTPVCGVLAAFFCQVWENGEICHTYIYI